MKYKITKIITALLISVLLLTQTITVINAATTTKTVYVYVTKTGNKYHVSTCRYLSKSKIKITLSDAKKRKYTSCSVCKPPK